MSVDNVRPEANPLFAFTLMIGGAFAAGLPMAVAIIWELTRSALPFALGDALAMAATRGIPSAMSSRPPYGSKAGGPSVGVIVVWRHHVGKIVGHENGQWIIQSGNDGRAVRTRPRSIAGAIAFRRA